MPKQKLSVVVTRRLPEEVETRLCELFDVTLREDDTPMDRAALIGSIKAVDQLQVSQQIQAALIQRSPQRQASAKLT